MMEEVSAKCGQGLKLQSYRNAYDNLGEPLEFDSLEGVATKIGNLTHFNTVGRGKKQHLPMIKFTEFDGERKLENIVAIGAIECEQDNGQLSLKDVDKQLTDNGISYIGYDSPSSTPEHPKWRLIFPLSQPLVRTDFGNLEDMNLQRRRILARINGLLEGCLAPESDAMVQCWFAGQFDDGYKPRVFLHSNGYFIDQEKLAYLEPGIFVKEGNKVNGSGGVPTIQRVQDLTLGDVLIDKDGKTRTLREWLPELKIQEKIRMQGKTFRQDASGSDSCILELTKQGRPSLHDTGTGTTHHLVRDGWIESDSVLEYDDSDYLAQFTNKVEDSESFSSAIKINLRQMLRYLVQINKGMLIGFTNRPGYILTLKEARSVFAGNSTMVGRDSVPTFKLWLSNGDRNQADSITFRAGRKVMTLDPNGQQCLNLWGELHRPDIPLAEAERISKPFFDHVRYLFLDRSDDFLDWLAHIEQHPSELPHRSWLHIAVNEGTGRGLMCSILSGLWRPYTIAFENLSEILDSNFNEELSGRIFASAAEVKEGSRGQWKNKQKFKAILTAKEYNVKAKYQSTRKEYNNTRWLMCSNHENALPVDNSDRRVEVIINREQPQLPEYYTRLLELETNKQFIHAIGIVLQKRDLDGFNLVGPAKVTEDKKALIKATSNGAQDLVDMVLKYWQYDVITVNTLMGVLTGLQHLPEGVSSMNEQKRYSDYLKQFKKINKGQHRLNGKRVTLYVVNPNSDYTSEDCDKTTGQIYQEVNRVAVQVKGAFRKSMQEGGVTLEQKQEWEEKLGWENGGKGLEGFPVTRLDGVQFRNWFHDTSL